MVPRHPHFWDSPTYNFDAFLAFLGEVYYKGKNNIGKDKANQNKEDDDGQDRGNDFDRTAAPPPGKDAAHHINRRFKDDVEENLDDEFHVPSIKDEKFKVRSKRQVRGRSLRQSGPIFCKTSFTHFLILCKSCFTLFQKGTSIKRRHQKAGILTIRDTTKRALSP